VVRKGTKKPRKRAKTDRFPLIEGELRKRTSDMLKADRVGLLCDKELVELRGGS
jgi:hypothetical protein